MTNSTSEGQQDSDVEVTYLLPCLNEAQTIVQAIEEARQLWIKTAYDEGQNIPLPRDMEEYTGKFVVRIPRGLHRDLVRAAKQEGTSLNQYVTSLLASGISQDIMETQAVAMARFMMWSPTAKVWGSTEDILNYNELLSIPQSEAIGK